MDPHIVDGLIVGSLVDVEDGVDGVDAAVNGIDGVVDDVVIDDIISFVHSSFIPTNIIYLFIHHCHHYRTKYNHFVLLEATK